MTPEQIDIVYQINMIIMVAIGMFAIETKSSKIIYFILITLFLIVDLFWKANNCF
jgi:hypothetical protein